MVFYGLCCLNTTLRAQGIFCARTITRKNFTVQKAKSLAEQNIRDIAKLIQWNSKNGIYHLRVSSDLFPHYIDSEVQQYTIDFALPSLKEIGQVAKAHKHRLTMHPALFNHVGSPNPKVFDATCKDLQMHAKVLDAMNADVPGSICIHIGGTYGDKEVAKKNWAKNFERLSPQVQRRIGIQNCEHNYNVKDCLQVSKACGGIPVIFDYFHDICYRQLHPEEKFESVEELMGDILATWKGHPPNFHISEQAPQKRVGTHADYVKVIPEILSNIKDLHLEIEAKEKELAVMALLKPENEKN